MGGAEKGASHVLSFAIVVVDLIRALVDLVRAVIDAHGSTGRLGGDGYTPRHLEGTARRGTHKKKSR